MYLLKLKYKLLHCDVVGERNVNRQEYRSNYENEHFGYILVYKTSLDSKYQLRQGKNEYNYITQYTNWPVQINYVL